jgi:hypothetical protein
LKGRPMTTHTNPTSKSLSAMWGQITALVFVWLEVLVKTVLMCTSLLFVVRILVHWDLGFGAVTLLTQFMVLILFLCSRCPYENNRKATERIFLTCCIPLALYSSFSYSIQEQDRGRDLVDGHLRSWLSGSHSYLVVDRINALPEHTFISPLHRIVRINMGYTVKITAYAVTKDGQNVSALLTASFAVPEMNRRSTAIRYAYERLGDETVGSNLRDMMASSFKQSIAEHTSAELNGKLFSLRSETGNKITRQLIEHNNRPDFAWAGDKTVHIEDLNPNFDTRD